MVNKLSECKRRKDESHTSRSGATSREQIEDCISPTMYQEEDRLKVVLARSKDNKACENRSDKHPGRIAVEVLPRQQRMMNYEDY